MLQRLRFHRVIGSHHKHNEVHASCTGKHIAHKFFMPRNIDDPQFERWKEELSKSRFNGDTAFLFFWKAIGVRASERVNQSRFAVVDMACCSQNERDKSRCRRRSGLGCVCSRWSVVHSFILVVIAIDMNHCF